MFDKNADAKRSRTEVEPRHPENFWRNCGAVRSNTIISIRHQPRNERRIETGSYPTRSFSYTYNLFGDLKSETYPSGRVLTSTYDGAERPYSLSGLLGATTTGYVGQAWYWPNGTPFYFTRGGSANLWHVNALNPRMQVSESYESIGNAPGVAAMPFVSCPNWGYHTGVSGGAWDACPHVSTTTDNGNLQGYTEYHGGPGRSSYLTFSQTFGYDNLNRLTSATDSGGWSRNFSYDQFGNMAPSVGSGTNYIALAGNSPTAFNTANNQISGPTGTTYDAAGNQTLVNGNAVAYDAENRTKSLASGAWTYSFDGLGQRVQKTPYSGSSTAYVYDAFGQLAAEYTSGTTWARDYIHWGSSGALIATENASGPCTTCYFGYDHLGSVKIVLDQSANVIGRHDFLPYGEEVPASTAGRDSTFGPTVDTVTTKFTSQLRDAESGMDYFNARNFTPALGRFMSPDPGNAGASLADPQTWNGYAYVRNSPLHMVDPSGMDGFGSGGGDPGDPDPCIFDCDPFPPYEGGGWGGGSPISTPPAPPRETSSSGGNPLPPGSFPNGETLGLPGGIGVPSVLQVLLGTGTGTPCDFGACNGLVNPIGGIGDPTTNPTQFRNYAILQVALNLLRRSPIMKSVMGYIDDSSRDIRIRFNNKLDNSTPTTSQMIDRGGFGVVNWDPEAILICPGGGIQSPAIGLAEELAHNFQTIEHRPGEVDDDPEERRVRNQFINALASSLGNCTRSNHTGTLIH